MSKEISTANAVWIATALLHKENPKKEAFRTGEIFAKVNSLNLLNVSPDTIKMHISSHCVADGKRSPDTHRKLKRVGTGWYRLYVEGEKCHEDRKNGKTAPIKESIPEKYRELVDWYNNHYSIVHAREKIIGTVQQNYENENSIQYSQIREGNKISVPNHVLHHLNVDVEDHLAFVIQDDGSIILKKAKVKVEILE